MQKWCIVLTVKICMFSFIHTHYVQSWMQYSHANHLTTIGMLMYSNSVEFTRVCDVRVKMMKSTYALFLELLLKIKKI